MQKKIHLFNCDHLYELRVIEDLLNSSKPMLHDKLGFDFTVEHHYFSLNEIDELSEKVIPSLKMDFAVFVVHAQESRVSINDGRGYTKVYRALMKATGGNVIIVIGGDNNYKNEEEEERLVISPWARRIVCVQFNEEYLDGRKSFVFSWGEKHREIHVEALMHFFDADKNGEKFKYQLPIKPDPTLKPRRKTRVESILTEAEENKCPSDIGKITQGLAGLDFSVGLEIPSYGQKDQSYKTGGISGADIGSQAATHQRAIGSTMVPNPLNSPQETLSFMEFEGTQIPPRRKGLEFSTRGIDRPGIQSQGAKTRGTTSFTKQPQETNGGLALVGCSVSQEAIETVKQVLESIGPKLNLHAQPAVMNLPPAEAKQYLERHSPQFCVLVVDGQTVKDAYENLPARRSQYEDLFKTAEERVAIRVILLVCGSLFLPNEDEEIIHRTIYDTIKKKDKGFIGWLKNGRLTVDTDVLVQLLNPALAKSFRTPSAQGETNISLHSFHQRRHLEQPPERKPGYGLENENLQQQRESFPVAIPTYNTKQNRLIGKLVLKSKLRYGNISLKPADLKFLSREFREIPKDIVQHLLQTNKHVDERRVKVMLVPSRNEELVYVGDQEIEMADNDLILLKTRVRNGLVSFHDDDVEVRYPADWRVPGGILEDLKRTASNGKLFIISDEKGNLRCTVKTAVKDTVVGVRDVVLAWIWPF